jgi:hypothetical protein
MMKYDLSARALGIPFLHSMASGVAYGVNDGSLNFLLFSFSWIIWVPLFYFFDRRYLILVNFLLFLFSLLIVEIGLG